MKSKTTGIFALIVTITTFISITGILLDVILNGSVDTFEQAIAYVSNPDISFYENYMNVSLLTIFTSVLFAGFYKYFKKSLHVWATIGILFVPIFCSHNWCYPAELNPFINDACERLHIRCSPHLSHNPLSKNTKHQ